MFSRDSDKTTKVSNSASVIGVEMQINGNIKCSGNLVLKGKVKGNIECDHISISSEGFPIATVRVTSVVPSKYCPPESTK